MLKYFRDRKSIGWLVGAGLLFLVIAAFVLLYIPDFMSPSGPTGTGNVAWVEGSPITAQEFQRSYRAQENQYRAQLGSQFSPGLMRQLGFDNLVVRELVQNKILLLEAERQGLNVTDEEVGDAVVSLPVFQADGKFIGRQAYLDLLAQNALNAATFEQQIRQDLLRQKLQALVTDGIIIGEKDVEEEFRRRNEKVHLEYAFVPKSEFEDEVEVSEDEAKAYFDAHPEQFRRPVQRKVRFITLTPQLFTTAVTVTEREIERYYQENRFRWETSEQVQASHILFKTGPDIDEEVVRKKAEDVLAKIRAGADFAEMAREYSEDTSAEDGGDLGLFGRGQMVPEFEQAAFSLKEGEVSDLVRSQYGFHIIKVTGHQAPFLRSLDSVKDEIRGTLTQEKAQALMEGAVDSASEKLRAAGNVDALAAEYELLVPQETPFFGRQETVPQLGGSRDAVTTAFETPVGQVTPAIRLGNGYAFLQILEERPAGLPEFDEVKEQARSAARNDRLMDKARAKAEEIREKLVAVGPEAAGVEMKDTESFFRGSQLPEAGRSAAVQARAFDLPVGEYSEPLPADNGYVIAKVVEKSGYSKETFEAQKADFEQQMLNERRLSAWNAFVASLQSRYDVQVDWQSLRSLTG